MTREEAMTRYNAIKARGDFCEYLNEEMVDMAIKALSQEPCTDAISRDAVMNEVKCWIGSGEYRYTNATDYLSKRIRELPSVSTTKNIVNHGTMTITL